ncbi:hypothetical protein RDI58_016608 [Solanum bulbocastanum]|uniref:Uncharacterized protein n=1 Tax=Solanum bulbocastanum TaxID=147425 RepID=A0AAN8YG71_SOLBU
MQEDSVYDQPVFGHRDYIYCSNSEARIARVQHYIPSGHAHVQESCNVA